MIPAVAPPPVSRFQHLVDIVSNGTLDAVTGGPRMPYQCEPHAAIANDAGCKWHEAPQSWWGHFKTWAGVQWDFLLEVFSDGD